MMLIKAALAAWRQVFSPPLRNVLWKSLALTIALLALIWFVLTRVLSGYLAGHPLSADYPVLDTFAFFFAGAGLLVALTYLIPAVSAIVAGYFLDDVAERVEETDFPSDPPGQALPAGKSLLYGLRFAGLSLLVNLAALILFFVPVVNIGAFFVANAYLLGRG
jgi:CysZ protein